MTDSVQEQLDRLDLHITRIKQCIAVHEPKRINRLVNRSIRILKNIRNEVLGEESTDVDIPNATTLTWSKPTNVYIPASGYTGGVVPSGRPVILTQAGIPKGQLYITDGEVVIESVYAGNHNDNREHYRFKEAAKDIIKTLNSSKATVIVVAEGKTYKLEISDLNKRHG